MLIATICFLFFLIPFVTVADDRISPGSSITPPGYHDHPSERIPRKYSGLENAIFQYRSIAAHGGWQQVSHGKLLKAGDSGARVLQLKQRLLVTGDLDHKEVLTDELFDEELHQAVVHFQWRHGLEQDGIVGPRTLRSLNVPAETRLRQLEVTAKKFLQLPVDMGRRYIVVNIAAFMLEVIEDDNTVTTMKTIVGKPYWYTPLFTGSMTHIVLNPSWHVPDSIAVKEILPKIQQDPDLLAREGFRVYNRSSGAQVSISDITWKDVGTEDFPYRFVQTPGDLNPLGRIKFVFPNRFNVYLHDTPAKVLFGRSSRAFSHGCIRIEKPVELAEYVLKDDPLWTRGRILEMIGTGREVKVMLPTPVPVHIVYLTSWVDGARTVHFREDIYKRD